MCSALRMTDIRFTANYLEVHQYLRRLHVESATACCLVEDGAISVFSANESGWVLGLAMV